MCIFLEDSLFLQGVDLSASLTLIYNLHLIVDSESSIILYQDQLIKINGVNWKMKDIQIVTSARHDIKKTLKAVTFN